MMINDEEASGTSKPELQTIVAPTCAHTQAKGGGGHQTKQTNEPTKTTTTKSKHIRHTETRTSLSTATGPRSNPHPEDPSRSGSGADEPKTHRASLSTEQLDMVSVTQDHAMRYAKASDS